MAIIYIVALLNCDMFYFFVGQNKVGFSWSVSYPIGKCVCLSWRCLNMLDAGISYWLTTQTHQNHRGVSSIQTCFPSTNILDVIWLVVAWVAAGPHAQWMVVQPAKPTTMFFVLTFNLPFKFCCWNLTISAHV